MRVNRFGTKAEKINAAQLIQQRNSGFGKDFRTAQAP